MKNSINICNNANLILDTYKRLFFKLLVRLFDVVGQLWQYKTIQQDSVEMQRLWNLDRSKYLNS